MVVEQPSPMAPAASKLGTNRRLFEQIRRPLRQPRVRVGAGLLLIVVALAIFGPLISPHTPSEFVAAPLAPPTWSTILGADYLGEDVLSRVLWGGWSVLWMSVSTTVLAGMMGVSIGLLAGYTRTAIFDELPMRLLDVILSIPGLIFVLLFVSMFGSEPWLIVVCVAIAFTPSVARIARGATLDVAKREFIEWADANGISRRHVLFREILPHIATPVTVELGVRLRYAISVISAVSFLGLGIQPPAADWGLMINENKLALYSQPWALVAPLVCISLFTLGSNLVAEGIARTISGVGRTH